MKIYVIAVILLVVAILFSCHRKQHTGRTSSRTESNNINTVTKKDSVSKKTLVTRKDLIPKVIVVNDSVARRSVDGRYYYDLLGHRYWRNNKDGKYYIFNKSMYTNDAFKSPGK